MSFRPTVFPYNSNTDFELELWHSEHPHIVNHLHQLTPFEYRNLYINFRIYSEISFRAHLFLLNFHCPSPLFTPAADLFTHFQHISSHLGYPFTFHDYQISHTRARELIFKFQKTKLIEFAEFWVDTSNTNQILLNRVRLSHFLRFIPAVTTDTAWHLRYHLNNTNDEYDVSSPLVSQFFDYIQNLEHTSCPIFWHKYPENFQPIVDPSCPLNLHTFSTDQLIQLFSYTEIHQLLSNFANLIAPQIDHFPPSFIKTRPPIKKYVRSLF